MAGTQLDRIEALLVDVLEELKCLVQKLAERDECDSWYKHPLPPDEMMYRIQPHCKARDGRFDCTSTSDLDSAIGDW